MKSVARIIAVIVLVLVGASREFWNSIRSAAAGTLGAQAGSVTTQYAYDNKGRLTMVYTPNDQAVFYSYDAAGNITSIRQAASLELISFDPQSGTVGTSVTFTGIGFASGVTSVSFNGALSTSIQVTPPTIVATVPPGATSGIVTITTGRGTVMTPIPFTVFVGS